MQTNPLSDHVPDHRAPQSNRVQEVAKEFESVFVSILLRSMRKTVGDGGLIPRGLGEKIYTDMLDDEYARKMSALGSFGLADLIAKDINGREGESPDLDALKGLGRQAWELHDRFVPSGQSASPRAVNSKELLRRVSRYERFIDEAAEAYGIDRDLIASVIARESAGNPHAVSHAGAKGLMQLMDATAREMGVSRVFDPRANIFGGTRYLKEMLQRFDGNEELALASYNAGPSAVERYGGVPPYRETQEYVVAVRNLRSRFAELRTDQ